MSYENEKELLVKTFVGMLAAYTIPVSMLCGFIAILFDPIPRGRRLTTTDRIEDGLMRFMFAALSAILPFGVYRTADTLYNNKQIEGFIIPFTLFISAVGLAGTIGFKIGEYRERCLEKNERKIYWQMMKEERRVVGLKNINPHRDFSQKSV